MQIHLVQHDIVWESPKETCAQVEAMIDAHGFGKGDLLVLPELFSTGFSMNVAKIGEKEDGFTSSFLARIAKRKSVFVVGGAPVIAKSGRVQNQAVCVDNRGEIVARYAKMQPFTPAGESDNYEAGAAPLIFDWHGVKVAPLICYDLRFPEVFRAAVKRGAELFCVIASWPAARAGHRDILLPARALENQAYVVGLNRVGKDPKCDYNGGSCVIDFAGNVVARAESAETILTCPIDIASLRGFRGKFPWLSDMRNDLIG